jgi:hypothetical protein
MMRVFRVDTLLHEQKYTHFAPDRYRRITYTQQPQQAASRSIRSQLDVSH